MSSNKNFYAAISAHMFTLSVLNTNNTQIITTGTTVLNSQQWYTLAFTYSAASNNLSLFVDGVLDASTIVALAPIQSPGTFSFCAASVGNAFPFIGYVDELFITNNVLTMADFQSTGFKSFIFDPSDKVSGMM